MKKRSIAILALTLIAARGFADAPESRWGVTPALGVFAVWGGSEIRYCAPLVTGNIQYRLTARSSVGGRLGTIFSADPDNPSITPLIGINYEYQLTDSLAVGIEAPVLPSVFVTVVQKHQFTFGMLPFMLLGTGPTVSVSYGYTFR